jgi:hypothetical protein
MNGIEEFIKNYNERLYPLNVPFSLKYEEDWDSDGFYSITLFVYKTNLETGDKKILFSITKQCPTIVDKYKEYVERGVINVFNSINFKEYNI